MWRMTQMPTRCGRRCRVYMRGRMPSIKNSLMRKKGSHEVILTNLTFAKVCRIDFPSNHLTYFDTTWRHIKATQPTSRTSIVVNSSSLSEDPQTRTERVEKTCQICNIANANDFANVRGVNAYHLCLLNHSHVQKRQVYTWNMPTASLKTHTYVGETTREQKQKSIFKICQYSVHSLCSTTLFIQVLE